jgi:hypothetical protein
MAEKSTGQPQSLVISHELMNENWMKENCLPLKFVQNSFHPFGEWRNPSRHIANLADVSRVWREGKGA